MRYFLDLAYHGADYHGWQIQENATGIQQVVNESFSKILGEEVKVTASGRTDKGVHAEQQIIHLDSHVDLKQPSLKDKLNAVLPASIAVKSIWRVKPDAHARFSAIGRSYEYRLSTHKNPFKTGLSNFYYGALDMEAMNKAAALLVTGEDKMANFASFSRKKTDVATFNCQVFYAQWRRVNPGCYDEQLIFYISANRFLRGMVRAIVGTLLEVGNYNLGVEDFKAIMDSQNREKAGASVAAKGLFLTAVYYEKDIFED